VLAIDFLRRDALQFLGWLGVNADHAGEVTAHYRIHMIKLTKTREITP
jgi:hypothetical protein